MPHLYGSTYLLHAGQATGFCGLKWTNRLSASGCTRLLCMMAQGGAKCRWPVVLSEAWSYLHRQHLPRSLHRSSTYACESRTLDTFINCSFSACIAKSVKLASGQFGDVQRSKSTFTTSTLKVFHYQLLRVADYAVIYLKGL